MRCLALAYNNIVYLELSYHINNNDSVSLKILMIFLFLKIIMNDKFIFYKYHRRVFLKIISPLIFLLSK